MSVLYLSFYFNHRKYESAYFSGKLRLIICHGAITVTLFIIMIVVSIVNFLSIIYLYFEKIQGVGTVEQYSHISIIYIILKGVNFLFWFSLLYHLKVMYSLLNENEYT